MAGGWPGSWRPDDVRARSAERAVELLARWRASPPLRVRFEDAVELLVRDYHAYEIPLYTNHPEDYANDEEIREDLIDTLLTITDLRVIAELRGPDAYEIDPARVDEYMRWLFAEPSEEVDHSLSHEILGTQHALAQRISIVLEREGEFVTGFKAYGLGADTLNERLALVIGWPERRPQDPPDGPSIRHGDLSDDNFVDYLERLAAAGLI